MQLLSEVKGKATQFASENASALLTAAGVVGTVATAVLAGRAGYKLGQTVLEKKGEIYAEQFGPEEQDNPVLVKQFEDIIVPKKELFLAVAPEFILPVFTGSATVMAIIMANRISAKEAAALAAAYGLAERNLADYKAKVEEKLTGPKKTQIDDELAQEQVDRTPGHDNLVIVDGEVLCLDRAGGRYFRSSMETIRQAVNTTNHEIHNHGFATADFFYKEVGLPSTDWASSLGFDLDNPVELTYSTAMAPGQKPCITFEFKYMPKTDYGPKHY